MRREPLRPEEIEYFCSFPVNYKVILKQQKIFKRYDSVTVTESITGRKARDLQTKEIGCQCLLKFCVAVMTPGST